MPLITCFLVVNGRGQKIFETRDRILGWDGTAKGETVATGVYAYFIQFTSSSGKTFEKSGTVTVLR